MAQAWALGQGMFEDGYRHDGYRLSSNLWILMILNGYEPDLYAFLIQKAHIIKLVQVI